MSGETPRIGDYEILTLLGAGGMGRVYKVRNVITDRIEAMKVLLPEIAGKEEVAARFLREIKVLAALNHPNIAALHTALTIDNQLLMIMEYVEGLALSSVLARGPLAPAEALAYIDQILDALSFAHQRHVIHRDIKPANMMLTPDGTVKLMDFGIAHTNDESSGLTAPGSTLGSINYMSPEQVKGERTDERSDLYSLGISLYELVTASRPFQGDTSYALMAAHVNQPPRPPIELQPDMPAGLNEIILTSIAKSPEERFQSADAFRHAVRTVLRELQESKTVMQSSHTETTGSRTPLPQVRTAPITRPKPAAPAAPSVTPVPLASQIVAAQQAATAPRSVATPVPAATQVVPPPPPSGPATQFAAPVAAAPAPASVAVPAPPPAMTQPASHRGLYISLGAVFVLVVLVAAGLYIPKSRKASAGGENAPPVTRQDQQPAPKPPASADQSSAAQSGGTQSPAPADQSSSTPSGTTQPQPVDTTAAGGATASGTTRLAVTKKDKKTLLAANTGGPPQGLGQGGSAAAPPAPNNAKELDEAEHEIDQLTARAAAVNSGLNNLKHQQANAGYGLRGDMAEKQASMNLNLSKAQDAIGHSELARAKRYAALATSDIEALEKFLGR